MSDRKQYTFTFEKAEEKRFRQIMERLDDNEYTVVEPIHEIEPEKKFDPANRQTVMEMEPEAASMFRFGMKGSLKIKRFRTPEEEAAKKELENRHKVVIKVKLNADGTIVRVAEGGDDTGAVDVEVVDDK